MKIFGNWRDPSKYQRLEFILTPCNYIYTLNGYDQDTVTDECIEDLEQQEEYLGNMQIVIFMSDQFFNQQAYGRESIESSSQFYKMQMDQRTPSYVEAFIT